MIDPLFAVHIADGVLSWPWLAAGFAGIALLALLACWRLREEEVPRVALISAAFFVASSIHVKLGPSSVHLLLNGLVGVMLGWRAPLAILLGVTLQALLIPHGGLTTIGVNACIEAVPALLAGVAFAPLLAACQSSRAWVRSLLIGASAFLWGGCLLFGVAVLWGGDLSGLVRLSDEAGVVITVESIGPAVAFCKHPATLVGLVAFAAICALAYLYSNARPELPAGVFLGVSSVVVTVVLAGAVLLLDRAETWERFVSLMLVAHLPLALLEGMILGVTVGFLARVKPQALRLPEPDLPPWLVEETVPVTPVRESMIVLLAAGALLWGATPARAHLLKVEATGINLESHTVTVESWYETGDPPRRATATVYRPDGSVLKTGPLDKSGKFVFTYDAPQRLRVVINAEAGHSREIVVTAKELGGEDTEAAPPRRETRGEGSRWRDLVLGLTFLLALGAFISSWLTARRVQRLIASNEAR